MSEGKPTKRNASGRRMSTNVPRSAPRAEPSPPRMTIERIKIDSKIGKLEGSIKVI